MTHVMSLTTPVGCINTLWPKATRLVVMLLFCCRTCSKSKQAVNTSTRVAVACSSAPLHAPWPQRRPQFFSAGRSRYVTVRHGRLPTPTGLPTLILITMHRNKRCTTMPFLKVTWLACKHRGNSCLAPASRQKASIRIQQKIHPGHGALTGLLAQGYLAASTAGRVHTKSSVFR